MFKEEDNSVVPNAEVILLNKNTGKVSKTETNEKGRYRFELERERPTTKCQLP